MFQKLLALHNPVHTQFQCEELIVHKEGVSHWGMLRQSIRELVTRVTVCANLSFELKEMQIDMDEAKSKSSDGGNPSIFGRRRHALKYEKLKFQIPFVEHDLECRIEEFRHFYACATALYGVIENMKVNAEGGAFGLDSMQELEYLHWAQHWGSQIATRRASGQGVSADLMRHLLTLPDRYAGIARSALEGDPEEWMKNNTPELPSLEKEQITVVEARRMIDGFNPKRSLGRNLGGAIAPSSNSLEDRGSRRGSHA